MAGPNAVNRQPYVDQDQEVERPLDPPPNIEGQDYDFGGRTDAPQFFPSGRRVPDPAASAGEPDIARDAPTPTPVPRTFHDIHCHMADYTGRGHSLPDVIQAANMNGIDRFTMIPIPTTLVSKLSDQARFERSHQSHHCGETYYVPKDLNDPSFKLSKKSLIAISRLHELRVNEAVDSKLLTQVSRAVKDGDITPAEMARMDLAMTGLHLGDPWVTTAILDKLANMREMNEGLQDHARQNGKDMEGHRLRFSQIGEVTLRKELVEALYAGDTQAHLTENIAPAREAMRLAGEVGLPWLLHCDIDRIESAKEDLQRANFKVAENPSNLEAVKKLLRECPRTDIIWAHAGGLGRFVKATPDHADHLSNLLEDPDFSHVKIDISWSQVAKQLVGTGMEPAKQEELLTTWAKFLVHHKDRILFGSDTLTPKTNGAWRETYDLYTPDLFRKVKELELAAGTLRGDVTPADDLSEVSNEDSPTLSRILFKNYEELMDKARRRVDAFTDHVLPSVLPGASHFAGPGIVDVDAIAAEREKRFDEEAKRLEEEAMRTPDADKRQALETKLENLNQVRAEFRTNDVRSARLSVDVSVNTAHINDAKVRTDALRQKQKALNKEIRDGISSLKEDSTTLRARLKSTPPAETETAERLSRLIAELQTVISELSAMQPDVSSGTWDRIKRYFRGSGNTE